MSSKVCRTCLNEIENENFILLSNEFDENLLISDYLKIYLSLVTIDVKNKKLPNFICPKCLDQLIEIKNFYKLCHDSENYFRTRIGSLTATKSPTKKRKRKSQIYVNSSSTNFQDQDVFVKTEPCIFEDTEANSTEWVNNYGDCETSENKNKSVQFHEKNIKMEENQNLYSIKNEEDGTIDDEPEKICHESKTLTMTHQNRKSDNYKMARKSRYKEMNEIIESFFEIKCDICSWPSDSDKKPITVDTLWKHYTEVHSIRGYIFCCGKKIYQRSYISQHAMLHQNPEAFKCNICKENNVFPNQHALQQHLLSHAKDTAFPCQKCDKIFLSSKRLIMHTFTHFSNDEKKFVCNECNKPYATEKMLQNHNRVVHEKKYSRMCEICAKVFNTRAFFEKHRLEEHTGKNLPKIQCTVCKAWLKNEHSMRLHMKRHNDAGKQHKCDVCGKIGPTRSAILKHKRYVHTPRKFCCDQCGKAFKQAIALKEHYATHTGETLYNCNFCSKTFNSLSNKHSHQKRMHPIEWDEARLAKLEALKPNENVT